MGPWHPSPRVRQSPSDYPVDDSNSAMKPMMFSGVGGSTILYGAQWNRFLISDFVTRSIDKRSRRGLEPQNCLHPENGCQPARAAEERALCLVRGLRRLSRGQDSMACLIAAMSDSVAPSIHAAYTSSIGSIRCRSHSRDAIQLAWS
jgi:hypothetical protein